MKSGVFRMIAFLAVLQEEIGRNVVFQRKMLQAKKGVRGNGVQGSGVRGTKLRLPPPSGEVARSVGRGERSDSLKYMPLVCPFRHGKPRHLPRRWRQGTNELTASRRELRASTHELALRALGRGARYAAQARRDGCKTRRRGVPSLPLEGKMLSEARQMRWSRDTSAIISV